MRPNLRLIPYLILVFVAYAVYSFMDEPIFEFLFFFLLALPLISGLLLLVLRRGLQWELVPLREEGRRLDEVVYLLKIENHLPIFLPSIRFLFSGTYEPMAFILQNTEPLAQGKLGALPPLETWLHHERQRLGGEGQTVQEYLRRAQMLKQHPVERYGFKQDTVLPAGLSLKMHLAAREEAIYRLSFLPGHTGIEQLQARYVLIDDLFSFFTIKAPTSTFKSPDYRVLPNPTFFRARVTEDLPDPLPVEIERWTDKIGNEVNALANIRNWRPGDRMKDIHWKVSAKAQEFFVKEYEDPRKGSILFLLDPYYPQLMQPSEAAHFKDELTEVTDALFIAMNRQEGPFTLRHLDQRIEVAGEGQPVRPVERYLAGLKFRKREDADQSRGLSQTYFEQIKSTSAKLGPSSLPSLSKMLRDEYKLESWRAIVIITGNIGRPLTENILRILRERTAQIVLVSAEPADYLAARFALDRAENGQGRASERLMRRAEHAVAEASRLEHLSLQDLFESADQGTNPLALREESLRRFRASGGLVFRAPFRSLQLPNAPSPSAKRGGSDVKEH